MHSCVQAPHTPQRAEPMPRPLHDLLSCGIILSIGRRVPPKNYGHEHLSTGLSNYRRSHSFAALSINNGKVYELGSSALAKESMEYEYLDTPHTWRSRRSQGTDRCRISSDANVVTKLSYKLAHPCAGSLHRGEPSRASTFSSTGSEKIRLG